MPVSIVVGGQYGSEGKGKVAHYLAREMHASFVVRCGGPNSGHTVIDENGRPRIFRQLPTAAILPGVKLVICAGSYIDLDVLFTEISETLVSPRRLLIDPEAVIITDELKRRERESGLIERISSTGSGTGAAVAARIMRDASVLFAKDVPRLKPFITDVLRSLRGALDRQERLIIEGTQGFGLSPIHSGFYPYVTSRDTTAAAFLAETGLSPLDVDDVVLVLRAFPIRVAGDSGALPDETNWETITKVSCSSRPLMEYTSVSKKIRRIARFHPNIVRQSLSANNPTIVVLNHLDYVDAYCNSNTVSHFVESVETLVGVRLNYLGFGPEILEDRDKALTRARAACVGTSI